MSPLRIAMGWASMRWSHRWPMRPLMERIFSKLMPSTCPTTNESATVK